jgi:hypothetical protein
LETLFPEVFDEGLDLSIITFNGNNIGRSLRYESWIKYKEQLLIAIPGNNGNVFSLGANFKWEIKDKYFLIPTKK